MRNSLPLRLPTASSEARTDHRGRGIELCAAAYRDTIGETYGFQVDSAVLGYAAGRSSQGARGSRFHFAERAREVKG